MPRVDEHELVRLLQTTADGNTEARLPSPALVAVQRRLYLYAEYFHLAPPAPPGCHGRLLVAGTAGEIRVIPLGDRLLELGRRETCDVPISDREVSQRHCRVGADATGAWIEDLGSTNGTWRNEQQVTARTALFPGDLIRIGRTALVYDGK